MNESIFYDLGVRSDYFLPLSGGAGQVGRDVFLGIRDGRIAKIAPWFSESWKARRFIEAKNQVVMPGLVNGHTHLPMTLFRGLADDLPFNEWLHQYIIPLEAKLVDPEFVRVGTELAALESIRSGVTTVCDMYFYEETIADVLDRVGLRALVSGAILDFPSPDNKDLSGVGFRTVERMCERFLSHPRITPCFGPHAPYTCGDETLRRVVKEASRLGAPVVMHVAETAGEVDASLKQHQKTPVKRLFDLGVLSQHSIFAHCVHLSDEDMELMAKTGTSAIYNPESNMKLSS